MRMAGNVFACAPGGRVIRPGLMRYGVVSERMIPAAKLHGSAKTSHAPVAASTTNGGTPIRKLARAPAASATRTNKTEWSRFLASRTVLIGVGEMNNN